jgi:uncharacterized membrane protein YqiK
MAQDDLQKQVEQLKKEKDRLDAENAKLDAEKDVADSQKALKQSRTASTQNVTDSKNQKAQAEAQKALADAQNQAALAKYIGDVKVGPYSGGVTMLRSSYSHVEMLRSLPIRKENTGTEEAVAGNLSRNDGELPGSAVHLPLIYEPKCPE